ncbi:hypothetical protein HMPREF0548_1634 [Lactobacillus ultunensis DSM 16047]|uniref:Uncharacterized protein n=2 Tax=Lactobacillus ultunensis TaxID=227945 RepID=C2EPN8_9LACO|nr:hypothetical protein HMPREF0548_1634 [Lactobacillus ultunensis DSM 16047]
MTDGLTFMDIFEVYSPEDKRVLMFQMPATPTGIPAGWKNRYYDRKGESLSEISFEKLDRIRGERRTDWSKSFVKGATINDLDPQAIKLARKNYQQNLKKFK